MDGGLLAFIGFGLMLGLSGVGSAIATGMTGSGVVGLLKKRPETFGSALVLAAVPSTQALYGFVGFIIFQGALGTGRHIDVPTGSIALGAGLALGLVCFLSAIYQAKVSCSGISAIASGHDVFGNTLILIAFPEFFCDFVFGFGYYDFADDYARRCGGGCRYRGKHGDNGSRCRVESY